MAEGTFTSAMSVVEPGTADDVPAVHALLDAARDWLRAREIDQWQDLQPLSVIAADARCGRLFVVRELSAVVAAVTILDDDAETWGSSGASALYVHRLVVAQSHRGFDLGAALLNWVAERAAGMDRRFVRLDCAADNPGLRAFYEREGFTHVRDVVAPSPSRDRGLAVSLYEKRVV